MPVSTTDLTTLDTVSKAVLKSDAEDALTREVFNSSGQFSEDGIRGISVASQRVEDYLNRPLIVKKHRVFLKSDDWIESDRTPNQDYEYRLRLNFVRNYPVLSVDEDVRVVDRRIFAKEDTLTELNYFAGYRREDQVLGDFNSDIQSEFGSEDDIPELPPVIVDVVNNLAIHNAVVRISGLIGKSISEQQVGDFRTTVRREQARDNYETDQLKRIQDYRFFT